MRMRHSWLEMGQEWTGLSGFSGVFQALRHGMSGAKWRLAVRQKAINVDEPELIKLPFAFVHAASNER